MEKKHVQIYVDVKKIDVWIYDNTGGYWKRDRCDGLYMTLIFDLTSSNSKFDKLKID